MELYSLEEVKQDIFDFEGVDLEITLEGIEDPVFYKLYSDFYNDRISKNDTVEMLDQKVFYYVTHCCHPRVNEEPDPRYRYTLYYEQENKLIKHSQFNTREEGITAYEEFGLLYSTVYQYDSEINYFNIYEKNLQ